MTTSRWLRLLAMLFAFALVAAACGSDSSDDDTSTGDSTTTDDSAMEDESTDDSAMEDESTDDSAMEDDAMEDDAMEDDEAMEEGAHSTDLSGVCPSPIVIQTDWNPEAEHGAIYEMLGEARDVDAGAGVVTGPLQVLGTDTGVDIEIRIGGPAIGFQQVVAQMYLDESIHFGYVGTGEAAQNFEEQPTIAVISPLEKNPQIVMWDPETYPDVETFEDLGEQNITIRHFGGATYTEVFVGRGTWSADQLDGSYDGRPAVFVAEGGKIAQQGFASAEPYVYKEEVEEWGKDVKFQLVHDAGFEIYSQPLAIRAGELDTLSECMESFVPIVQQAQIDYVKNPDRTNEIILDLVEQYDTGWVYSQGVADFSVQAQLDTGMVGNGPDSTLGNFDEARVQAVIDEMSGLENFDIPEGLKASDIVTNQFIDDSIGL